MLNTIQKFTPRDLVPKLKNEARAFVVAPIYPFLQLNWYWKMWIFGVLAYVPLVNITIARGWRMDYIHRLGWRYSTVLPAPKDALRFLINGLLLWIAEYGLLAQTMVEQEGMVYEKDAKLPNKTLSPSETQ